MGTPDTISSVKDIEPLLVRLGLVCPDGHPLVEKMQTKDLEEELLTYFLGNDADDAAIVRLYGPGRKKSAVTFEVSIGLEEISRHFYPRSTHTGPVYCSASCRECLPVFFEGTTLWNNDVIDQREMRFQAELWFDDGVLSRVSVSGLSRAQKRVQMLKDGVGVLPDDDRLVKRRIKELLEEDP